MTLQEHTFIVAVDYSDSSIAALDQTLIFAEAVGNARLLAVLVLPGGPTTSPPREARASEQLVERAKENLMSLVQARAEKRGGVHGLVTEAVVQFGDPAECILELAKSNRAYAVAVGTHGRRGVERFLVGSVAQAVVSAAETTVWVVRTPPEELQVEGETDEVFTDSKQALEGESPQDPMHTVLSAPHIDAGRVVLHLLDDQTGRRFLCTFQDFGSVSVQPVERRWVTPPASETRARVAREALAFSRLQRPAFEELFDELNRRNQ